MVIVAGKEEGGGSNLKPPSISNVHYTSTYGTPEWSILGEQ
jgi:hypothetical protein